MTQDVSIGEPGEGVVDPQLRVPEERLYMRYEDVVVVTDTGVENFTDFLPAELDDIEKLVGQGGIVQQANRFAARCSPKLVAVTWVGNCCQNAGHGQHNQQLDQAQALLHVSLL